MTNEWYAFFASIICGILAAVLWYAFDSMRKVFGFKALGNIVFDILWMCCGVIVFCVCIWELFDLRIRAFEFIGVGIGAFLCHILLKRPLGWIFDIIFMFFLKIFQFIFKILLTPWTFLYKILIRNKTNKKRKGKTDDSSEK